MLASYFDNALQCVFDVFQDETDGSCLLAGIPQALASFLAQEQGAQDASEVPFQVVVTDHLVNWFWTVNYYSFSLSN